MQCNTNNSKERTDQVGLDQSVLHHGRQDHKEKIEKENDLRQSILSGCIRCLEGFRFFNKNRGGDRFAGKGAPVLPHRPGKDHKYGRAFDDKKVK